MNNKGVVISSLCSNPDCTYSQEKLTTKSSLVYAVSSGSCTFKVPKCCPRCRAPIEVLHFVSGEVEIKPDVIPAE